MCTLHSLRRSGSVKSYSFLNGVVRSKADGEFPFGEVYLNRLFDTDEDSTKGEISFPGLPVSSS